MREHNTMQTDYAPRTVGLVTGLGITGILVIAGTVLGLNSLPAPEPTSTPHAMSESTQRLVDTFDALEVTVGEQENARLSQAAAEAYAAEQAAAEAARVAAEQQAAADAEAARIAAEQQAAQQVATPPRAQTPTAQQPAAPTVPVRTSCPAGTSAVSSDESGDTGCLPTECMTGAVDPATAPQCFAVIRP